MSGVLVRVRERFVAHRRIVRATAVALVIAVAGGLSAGGVVAAHRLTAPLPAAGVVIHASRSIVLTEGSPPPITLPPTGSLAVVSSATGLLAAVSSDVPRPIASVAKTMTAFVVLQAEPLTTDAPGPVLTMTATDVALYREAIAGQGSAVAVTAGERLSERDLLLMLMLPSANNIAETLARWVSGTRDTFVARENAEAAALGMQNTRFADPSGISPQTVSSAADLLKLARAAMAVPALAAVVATRNATLPDGTPLANLDILLGSSPDWLGIKTGWTHQAGGCLLFAARHSYATDAAPVTVYGAVLGQPPSPSADAQHPELGAAFATAQRVMKEAFAGYEAVNLATLMPGVTGTVSAPWGTSTGVAVHAARGVVVARLGTVLATRLMTVTVGATPGKGAFVGRLVATVGAATVVSWQLSTRVAISPPPWWWRLLHQ